MKLDDIMVGKTQVQLFGESDWAVTGKILGVTEWQGKQWIILETSSGIYNYQLDYIFAIKVGS